MQKFNKSFIPGKTAIQVIGDPDGPFVWRTVTEVHETKNWIKVEGLVGSFQRGHVNAFTNSKSAAKMNDLENFRTEGSSLFEKQADGAFLHVYRNDRLRSKEALIEAYRLRDAFYFGATKNDLAQTN